MEFVQLLDDQSSKIEVSFKQPYCRNLYGPDVTGMRTDCRDPAMGNIRPTDIMVNPWDVEPIKSRPLGVGTMNNMQIRGF